jgi:hypothetical protein
VLDEQVSPERHVVVQSPQCATSEVVSMQLPAAAQYVCPAPAHRHAPWKHVSPAWQALPQVPQFDVSA